MNKLVATEYKYAIIKLTKHFWPPGILYKQNHMGFSLLQYCLEQWSRRVFLILIIDLNKTATPKHIHRGREYMKRWFYSLNVPHPLLDFNVLEKYPILIRDEAFKVWLGQGSTALVTRLSPLLWERIPNKNDKLHLMCSRSCVWPLTLLTDFDVIMRLLPVPRQ